MATGTVEHSAPTEVQGSSPTSKSHSMRSTDIHEKEKHLIQSIRRSPQRSSNPFLINERRDDKQLYISSRSLHVNDFVLIKTLGTGEDTSARTPAQALESDTSSL
jgi:hypothetical protein